jgi:glutamate/tyrosine decarboxylase-like PLP-dependent enzyme
LSKIFRACLLWQGKIGGCCHVPARSVDQEREIPNYEPGAADPFVALTLDESVKRYNEFDISNKVREKGWILSAYSMPPDAQEINSLRIAVRPHMNRGS